MSLFNNGEPEDFLLFVPNFNVTLAASGMLEVVSKFQYLGTLFRRGALRQFDLLSDDVQSIETLDVDYIIRVLAQYFPPVNSLSEQKRAILSWMKKRRSLTVRRYAERLIDLNEYLASFPGADFTDNIGVTELNEILLNSMPNIWSKQACVQGFDCESITLKKDDNMFEHMEIAESIYKGIVEPYYNKQTRSDSNRAGHGRHKIVEAASSWTRPEKGENAGKRRKRHVYSPTGKSKTCMIHGPGHSSEECKVLGDCGDKYSNSRPTKNRGSNHIPRGNYTGRWKTTPLLTTQ